jgi:Uma2 family endonuclease
MTPQQLTDLETEIVAPDISHLVIEDDTPVDNFQSEKQQRCLVEPLYSSELLPHPFIVAANVGIFGSLVEEGIAPDVFVSLGVQMPEDWTQKQNRSYLVWQFGKFPDVVIEIVSNRRGNELLSREEGKSPKKAAYARMGIPYYAVFDPLQQIQEPEQMAGQLLKVFVLMGGRYVELQPPFWLESVGLGLTLWQGEFEGKTDLWLRWCNRDGTIIPTGAERAEAERQRAEAERQRAEAERQRAEAESQRAEAERQRAEAERQRADRLAERLRQMGINPEEL